jgi:hypothetical protein
LTLLILLNSCGYRSATTELNSAEWREDLQYLARELPNRHVNAFHTISREEFTAEVERLDAAIPRLNGDEVLAGLMRIVALIGDGHTHLDLSSDSPRYPIELQWFGDELRVIGAASPYQASVSARIIAVGSTPITDVMDRAVQLVPRGENDGRARLTATLQLTAPEVLHGLDLIADRANAPFALELDTGERSAMSFSPAPRGDISTWKMAWGEKPPLYLQHLNEQWWTQFLPDAQTVYFSFTAYPPDDEFRERTAALVQLLNETRARRLVIDLRRNQGGDFDRFRRLLLPVIKSNAAINRKGGLFVITGPGTFSAAVVNALDLRNEANAILAGAPTGARPNHYGDHGDFLLPNSGFRVSYATRYHRFGDDRDTAVFPDRSIEPTWAEFRAGRDPVMEWILSTTN